MIKTVNGNIIGDRVGTQKLCRLNDNDELFEAYYSKIEVNGEMVCVRDKDYIGGLIHASTRKEARQLAIAARDRILSGLSAEKGAEG